MKFIKWVFEDPYVPGITFLIFWTISNHWYVAISLTSWIFIVFFLQEKESEACLPLFWTGIVTITYLLFLH